jgi:hypothetical protein
MEKTGSVSLPENLIFSPNCLKINDLPACLAIFNAFSQLNYFWILICNFALCTLMVRLDSTPLTTGFCFSTNTQTRPCRQINFEFYVLVLPF